MSTQLWKPQFDDYKEACVWADEHLTADMVKAALAQLPADLVSALQAGPLPDRWACGICRAFSFYTTGKVDTTDPRWIVFLYHEAPKARMTRSGQLHYGPLANECYERGIETYRMAGWQGEAEEANA